MAAAASSVTSFLALFSFALAPTARALSLRARPPSNDLATHWGAGRTKRRGLGSPWLSHLSPSGKLQLPLPPAPRPPSTCALPRASLASPRARPQRSAPAASQAAASAAAGGKPASRSRRAGAQRFAALPGRAQPPSKLLPQRRKLPAPRARRRGSARLGAEERSLAPSKSRAQLARQRSTLRGSLRLCHG